MRISDWSSDVCSSDLEIEADAEGESDGDKRLQKPRAQLDQMVEQRHLAVGAVIVFGVDRRFGGHGSGPSRGGIAGVSGGMAADRKSKRPKASHTCEDRMPS